MPRTQCKGILSGSAVLAALLLAAHLSGCALISPQQGAESIVDLAPAVAPGTGAARGAAEYSTGGEDKAVTAPMQEGGGGTDASQVPREDRLIILNQNLRMEVAEVDEAIASLREIAAKHKGTITDMQVSTDQGGPVYRYDETSGAESGALQAYVTVRVPNESAAAFVAEASALGKVLRQSQSSQDVTQEHVDLAARLGNLRAEEARLREFFGSAKKVSEMLEIERELSRVRGEIESIDAQKKYLERQAAMATVTFELVEPQAVVRPQGENWGFVDSVTQSVRAFVGTLNVLVVLLGPVLAIGTFVVLPIFLLARWLVLRARRRAAAAAAAPGRDDDGS